MADYKAGLSRLPEEVSFGVTTIRIARVEDLRQLQVGYAVDPDGRDLAGNAEGDWKPNWVVIGQDDACGDPVFIDIAEESFPVYTAMHGQGHWQATPIAASLDGFRHALNAVSEVARGREHPVALESNPLTERERAATLSIIRDHNPGIDLEYWGALLDAS